MSETVPELTEEITQDKLDKLKNRNDNKYLAMAHQGKGIDPNTILSLRIETFVDTFLGEADKLAFDYNFHYRLSGLFDQALAQLRQQTLTEGVGSVDPKKLVIPGK